MKHTKIHFLVLILVVIFLSCEEEQNMHISGAWMYKTISTDSIVVPFRTFYPTSYPTLFDINDIVYIDSEKIELPLLRANNEFSIEGKFINYKLYGDTILLIRDSLEYKYDVKIEDNMLCIDNGRFCLVKLDNQPVQIDSTIFNFSVKEEFKPSFQFWMNYNYLSNESRCNISYDDWPNRNNTDTIYLSNEERSYIISLLSRIPANKLNRIYNNGLSDCREISIDFYAADGWWRGIETCGLRNQNPFEIRALTTNMFWILNSHLRKVE